MGRPILDYLPKGKKAKSKFLAQGLLACFNMCRQNSVDIHEHRKREEAARVRSETREKEILTRMGVPQSPVRTPRDALAWGLCSLVPFV